MATRRRTPRWRAFCSWLFLLLFCLAAPVALVTGWARALVDDPEAYASAVNAAAADPRVQESLAEAVALRAQALLGGENPTATEAVQMRALAEELGAVTGDVIASPEFAAVWETANRAAYAFLVAELDEGWGEPVDLDLSPLTDRIQAEIDARALDTPVDVTIDPDILSIEVLDAATADQIRRAVQDLAIAFWGALAVGAVSLLLAVGLARDRLLAVARAGFGLSIAMVALIALLLVGQGRAAAATSDAGGAVALMAIADAATQGLRLSAIGLALGGLLVAGVFAGLSALRRGVRRERTSP